MLLRIEEYRFEISRIHETRTDKLMYRKDVETSVGYIDFKGTRLGNPYDGFLYIEEIKEDGILLVIYKDDEVLRKIYNIMLYEEDEYQVKGSIRMPAGYWYRFRLLDKEDSL